MAVMIRAVAGTKHPSFRECVVAPRLCRCGRRCSWPPLRLTLQQFRPRSTGRPATAGRISRTLDRIMQVKSNDGYEPVYVNVRGDGDLYNDSNHTVLASGMWVSGFT
jgi:hypothetical protein